MSNIFNLGTETGQYLQEGYEKLLALKDYDPDCEMVDVINEFDHLPKEELELESMQNTLNKISEEFYERKSNFTKSKEELISKIANAEVKELEEEL